VLLLIAPQSASERLPEPTPDLTTVEERFTIEDEPPPSPSVTPSGTPDRMTSRSTDDEAETCVVHTPEPVMVHVFDDFLCPYCEREFREALFPLHQQGFFAEQDVEVRFHTLPVHGERSAQLAKAAWCAREVDEPWLFRQWLYDSAEKTPAKAEAIAVKLGAEAEAYRACLDSPEAEAALAADIEFAQNYDITGTPALVIDDFTTIGMLPQENIAYEVRKAIAKNREKPLNCGG